MSSVKEANELLVALLSEAVLEYGNEFIEFDDEKVPALITHAKSIKAVKRQLEYRKDIEKYVSSLGYPRNSKAVAKTITLANRNADGYFDNLLLRKRYTATQIENAKVNVNWVLNKPFGSLALQICDIAEDDGGAVGAGEILFAMLTGLERVKGEKEKADVGGYSLKSFTNQEGKFASAKLGTSYEGSSSNVSDAITDILDYIEKLYSDVSEVSFTDDIEGIRQKMTIPQKALSSGLSEKSVGTSKSLNFANSLAGFIKACNRAYNVKNLVIDPNGLANEVKSKLDSAVADTLAGIQTIGVVPTASGRKFKLFDANELEFDSLTEYRIKVIPMTDAFVRATYLALEKAGSGSGLNAYAQGIRDIAAVLKDAVDNKKFDKETVEKLKSRNLDIAARTITSLTNEEMKSWADALGVTGKLSRKTIASAFNEYRETFERLNGMSGRSKLGEQDDQNEMSMGGVAGVTTPIGTGPDGGKGGPAARRKGKRGESTLGRNARTQGRGFGNAKRVDEASTTTTSAGDFGYMDGTGARMDIDGDGNGDIRSSPKGTDTPIFRGGGGDLEHNAEQIGPHFAGASPIRDFHELVGILLGGEDLTPAQRAHFKGTAPSSKAGEFWKPHRGTKS